MYFKPILCIFTALGCGACASFKAKMRDSLISYLRTKNVEIKEKEFPTFSAESLKSDPEYHPQTFKFVKWFPCFAIFPQQSFDNKDGDLEGDVCNGLFQDNKWVLAKNVMPTLDQIIEWAENNIKKYNALTSKVILIDSTTHNEIKIRTRIKGFIASYDENLR